MGIYNTGRNTGKRSDNFMKRGKLLLRWLVVPP